MSEEEITTGRVHIYAPIGDDDPDVNYVLKCQDAPHRTIKCQTLNLNGEHPYHAPDGTEIGVHPGATIRLIYDRESRDGGHVTIYPNVRSVTGP